MAFAVVFIAYVVMILISDVYKKYRDEALDTARTLDVERLRQKVIAELESQDTHRSSEESPLARCEAHLS